MRFAPFALFALCALPACAPYGYGYAGSYAAPAYGGPAYGGPAYGAPAPDYYGSPYYGEPGYVAPAAGGVLLFGGGRDERRDGRRADDRRYDNRGGEGRGPRPQPGRQEARPAQRAEPQRPASVFAGPQRGGGGGGGGGGRGGHAPDFNPASPGAQGGADR